MAKHWRVHVSILPALALAITLGCSRGQEGAGQSRAGAANLDPRQVELLNVSYDPTREFYREFNQAFAQHWKETTGQTVEVRQSHGGSGSQARAVIEGQEAHVVTLALAYDIDIIGKQSGLIPGNWQSRLPHNSSPYTSTIVFLVRQGNPKGIHDWNDLLKPDVKIITPNPKTSGGARWNYLAAWGYALKQELGSLDKLKDPAAKDAVDQAQKKAREFVAQLFNTQKLPVLDTGARGSTNTFVQREMGDVLLAWENEALLQTRQLGQGKFEIVLPSISILAEPPVTVVDKVVDKRGTRRLAEAYLRYLYEPAGQELAAKHYYRPTLPEVAAKYRGQFPPVELFTIDNVFGGWQKAQKEHFDDGGTFDAVYK